MDNRKIAGFSAAILLILGIYEAGKFIVWLNKYVEETGFGIAGELGPLLGNCFFMLGPILVLLLVYKKKEISKGIVIMTLLSLVSLLACQIIQLESTDPLQAGLLMVLLAFPLSFVLCVVALKILFQKD